MAFDVKAFALKIPVPFLYSLSGYVATEIPVLLNLLPATFTFSGTTYTTALLAGGLAFVASGAIWLHTELKQFISAPSQAAPATQNPSGATAQPTAPKFTLDSNMTNPILGSSFILSVNGGAPNDSVEIIENDNNQEVTVPIQLDANGNGSMQINNMNTLSPIGFVINGYGSITIHGRSVASGNVTESITLT